MRYFIGFLVTVGLVILLIFMLFHGGSKPKVPGGSSKPLVDYATTDAEASMTIQGQVTADQQHNEIRVVVGRDSVTYQQIRGYNGQVVNQQTYANNQNAYATFLSALGKAGFTQGDSSKALQDNRGYCSLGQTYIFEMQQDGEDLERYWATSCGGVKTYDGNLGLTTQLFQNQVADYATLTQNVQL